MTQVWGYDIEMLWLHCTSQNIEQQEQHALNTRCLATVSATLLPCSCILRLLTLTIRLKRHAHNKIPAVNFAASWFDGATVHHDRGPVEPGHGHHHTRHVLVTTWQGDVAIVPLPHHHSLYAVCNDVS